MKIHYLTLNCIYWVYFVGPVANNHPEAKTSEIRQKISRWFVTAKQRKSGDANVAEESESDEGLDEGGGNTDDDFSHDEQDADDQ